ncbi:hypothetical protein [Brevundimonas variabilis]|uniref:ASC-1-like (ASCH) protein n=1 Tax=Brevundimonas variabilis TaxID=74312 RepID=A0A7W9CIM0_9CAUL|nr:hypothetical protein [Brevundimonas variabilis]MBB5746073.1 ASC-1-like (ASCH) protein [Brevundimonas variabilis]
MNRHLQTPCTIEVEHSDESLHAHVALDGDPDIRPGDQVLVHGDPIHVAFGQRRTFRRFATVRRASPLERLWTKVTARFELSELYDVSFTPRRSL